MKRHYVYLAGVLLLLCLSIAGAVAWWQGHWPKSPPSLLLAGSGAMQPLNQALLSAFAKRYPEVDVVVEGGGSTPGLIAAKRRAIDIAAMSRDLSVNEDDPLTRSYLIAKSDLALVVNRQLPIASLTQAQVRALFNGGVRNWKQLGGPNAPVHLLSRPADSAAHQLLDDLVLQGDDLSPGATAVTTAPALLQGVERDPSAMTYVMLNELTPQAGLKTLAVDGVVPTRETIYSGRYPYAQSLYWVLYGDSTEVARRALAFAQSAPGQALASQNHLIPVRE